MDLKELQKFATEENNRLNGHYGLGDEHVKMLAHMTKVTEEVGELAEEVLMHLHLQRANKLANHPKENLEKEVADVIYTTAILASNLGVDLDKLMTTRIEEIKQRSYKE